MSRFCFTSVCTDDSYQFFIPLFVYSVKKAYPDAGVKVFLKGVLKDATKIALGKIKYDDWEVKENCFSKYPDSGFITNALRFLIGGGEFKGYGYVFVRDIDFLIFSHKISHVVYFSKRLKKIPYFGVRGPYRHPYRAKVSIKGWKGVFLRVAAGTFVFKNPEWYEATGKALRHYRHNIKRGVTDKGDHNYPGSYREYDEVMLGRIIRRSGLKLPRRKGRDAFGKPMIKRYRDMHLGDFSKNKHGYKRLCRRLSIECLRKFVELEKDKTWIEIRKTVCKANPKIREILRRVRKHAKRRLNSSCLSGGEIVQKK